MKKNILFIVLAIALFGISCKTTKKTNTNNSNITTENPKLDENTYRFVVSFISIGEGIDTKLNEDFTKLMADTEGKTKKKMNAENYSRGREGEIQYCLKLNDYTTKEKDTFLKEIKSLIGDSKLVILTENCACTNKK
ncbi:MAG: hypothetical protein HXX09_10815 [Bacteroidetes bacterium]|nr:hypothetical protein [Bacteroidota bacterium]